ncbi:glycosyltransferase family 4 protein [Vibrio parahaemolyticus]|uniref:Glycosyl transferase family protein n=1 Tax=Vibrio parahaemolyticus TaxID=670 RepID=A0A5P1PMN7_VIBPH|nr:glycosyltransferase family 4 protein [Vibrio parahaemolyticus]AMG05815.1 hypothetical protein AL464_02645 [Vibrio parahaemolyticus]EGR0425057.1 glycosyltransferase family 4 protein [Vibrio parahaemolyticus]EJG0782612.1 glycosyltransferase family 4 protein [Vibrio parahaemolyticus]EJG1590456.1 glycosyltransferase family 4 protein [Vibrio parahaemolyticus]EJH2590014.1 glycosyltransferase family 4 protein [Vibrio parahaemolyticus]
MKTRNRKILIFEDSSQCYFGGGQKVTLQTINVLKNIYEEIIVYDYSENSVFVKKVQELGIEVVFLKKIQSPFFLFNYIYNIIAFLFKVKGGGADFYISTKMGIIYTPLMCLLGSVFYHVHNVEVKGSIKANLMRMLIFVDKIICVSHSVKESLPSFIQKKESTLVVYNYFDGQFNRDVSIGKYKKIVFLGSLNGIKGVDIAIKAFRNSRLIPNDFQFIICGDGDKKNDLMALSKGDDRIVFKGFVDDIENVLTKHSALILPTVISEACPMSIIEATFNTIPVITGNIGGQKELLDISNYGFCFEKGDVESCMKAMEKLLDSNIMSTMNVNQNTEQFRKIFSRENYIKSIGNVFNRGKCEEEVTGSK